MKSKLRFLLTFIVIFALVMVVSEVLPAWLGDASAPPAATAQTVPDGGDELTPLPPDGENVSLPDEDGEYDGKEELALYIHLYGHLPKTSSPSPRPRRRAGRAERLTGCCPARRSAATAITTAKVCCRRQRAAPGPSAT